MQLFHLGSSKWAQEISGEGARLFGGRWNQIGDACLYTSGTRSLCVLEYLANVALEDLPPDLSFTEYSIPDKLCQKLDRKNLPYDWTSVPPTMSTKIFGSVLLKDKECTCFAVPSVIVPAELNYILNPFSTAFKQIQIISVESFPLDNRIKK